MISGDMALEVPRPLPPNVKLVGPIMAEPAKPLCADLEVSIASLLCVVLPEVLPDQDAVLLLHGFGACHSQGCHAAHKNLSV